MNSSVCLIEILMLKKCKGDKFWLSDLENEFHVFDQDCFIQLEEDKGTKQKEEGGIRIGFSFSKPDIQFTKDTGLFQFRFFGQNLDGEYANGLDFERCHIGYDIFDRWEGELVKLGNRLLADYKERGRKTKGIVRFVTVWTYSSWQDSYYGDFDSEWDLAGVLNTNGLNDKSHTALPLLVLDKQEGIK